MDAFRWNPCFVTGLVNVDDQHQQLVDVINRFGELVMQEGGAPTDQVEGVFAELAQYASYHFAEEEALMHAAGLDARYVEQHEQSHTRFLAEVTQLHADLGSPDRSAAKSLLEFLTHWLAYHILGSDQLMAQQMALINSGVSPQEAFQTQVSETDPATDALLKALNGLFQQVSDRNTQLLQLNKTLETRVAERTQALVDANQRLEDLASTDLLTGLPNRRYAMSRFAAAWQESVRLGTPLACMMIDADGFKTINDTHGHDAGDAVLKALSKSLSHAVRTDDIVCRLGGDEFLVICAGTSLDGGLTLAEKIRSDVAALRVAAGSGHWVGSVSVGVAARTPDMAGVDVLMKVADDGLYISKRNGRNCVATSQR
jgi:hemerythrin